MRGALQSHWPEYLMEAAGLGCFMIAACLVGILLQHPASPIVQAIPGPTVRRVLFGVAMGLTALGIIHSPWGQQSGAHLNPSVTMTFLRLGKIAVPDAFFYIVAQFAGGLAGVLLVASALGMLLSHESVRWVVTSPGPWGNGAAFAAELVISFVLMSVVLTTSNSARLARYTPFFAASLVAAYISLEAPVSGMSMNPARSLSSALPARALQALWIYFTAPPLGMLLAAEIYVRRRGIHRVFCAKLHHHNERRCIFHCGKMRMAAEAGQ
ncbi:MAG: aquaporin [Acidobacteria bacterium]|nr:aquaporin [Acidobacteriota bacterium]